MSNTWLYLDTPRMKGAAVRRWQEILLHAGYDLPKWGADGSFGDETDVATRKAQTDLKANGLYTGPIDGIVGPKTMAALDKHTEDIKLPNEPIVSLVGDVEVHDYRHFASPPKNYSYDREWKTISGVVLHRTACVLGEKPERYLPVNAHIGVTMGGRIVLAHAWNKMIWHGHAPSPWTIGIEFDGNPEGKPGYWWKPGGGPHPITDAQVAAADVLLDLLLAEFKRNDQELRYIVAHRQSSDQREADPGWECWQKIALPWMERTGAVPGPRDGHPPTKGLKLPVGYAGDTWGTGLQIPREWDPRSTIPFWK